MSLKFLIKLIWQKMIGLYFSLEVLRIKKIKISFKNKRIIK